MTVARNQIDEVLSILCSRFPNAFFMHEGKRKPLAVGIGRVVEAILGDEVKGPVLHRALQYYVGNFRYLCSLKVDAVRIDIDGNEAGRVTEEQAAFALEKLAARKAKQKKPPIPVVTSASPPTPVVKPPPVRDGLSALREAAARRRNVAA